MVLIEKSSDFNLHVSHGLLIDHQLPSQLTVRIKRHFEMAFYQSLQK